LERGLEVSREAGFLVVVAEPSAATRTSGASAVFSAVEATLSAALAGLLGDFEGGRHDFFGKVKVLAEPRDSLVSEIPVVPLPVELLGDQIFGLERLKGLDHVNVRYIQLVMLGRVEIFFGADDALVEEMSVNLLTILLRNQHDCP
jgi:hypothetical protein